MTNNMANYKGMDSETDGEIILIWDTQNQCGIAKHKSVVDHLTKNNIRFELIPQSVEDFLWIWRTPTKNIVLDYVIERKTLDDLKKV
uniref:Crossover junction endonuclease MUS81 n=1 Tax=Strongyloides venezuelensis TaxID=75913 RepID=A0A0K0EVZ0_STRVS